MLTGQLGRFHWAAESAASTGRGFSTANQRGILSATRQRENGVQWPGRASHSKNNALASTLTDARNCHSIGSRHFEPSPELQVYQAFPEANGSLPAALYRLLDPNCPVEFPAPESVRLGPADNRELDKLVAALGRNKATWRRAIFLHEWLLQIGHKSDDRLLTTLIRVCAQHGQVTTAIQLYDWMRTPNAEGGAGLKCTVYTYTAAMRAALAGNMTDKAVKIWEDAEANNANDIDCRLCTTLIEVHARRGDTQAAIKTYQRMRQAPHESKMAPTVHAYTAVMRAAAEGGQWEAALGIWDDMEAAGCKPTGHAYAAAISACAAGGLWQRAVALFDSMLAWGIKPDVVSCTALVTALGADGQWERAEKVVEWMLRNDIRPNVRTYTALVSALANAKQWERAVAVLKQMKGHALGPAVEPNAYTYSALLKAMGDHGKWALAEAVFAELEVEALAAGRREAAAAALPASVVESPRVGGAVEKIKVAAFPGMNTASTTVIASSSGNNDHSNAATAAATSTTSIPPAHGEESLEEREAATDLLASTMAKVLGSVDISTSIAEINLAADHAAAVEHSKQHTDASAPLDSPSGVLQIDSHSIGGIKSDQGSLHVVSLHSTSEEGLGTHSATTTSSVHSVSDEVVTPSTSSGPSFSYFSAGANANGTIEASRRSSLEWTAGNAAVSGLTVDLDQALTSGSDASAVGTSLHTEVGSTPTTPRTPMSASSAAAMPMRAKGPLNEVVCGALMLAYERAGKWQEAAAVLDRARALGIPPNTVMYNTAISALGKAGKLDAARALFAEISQPDAVSYETLIAAHGMAGDASRAEELLVEMSSAGFSPQDYAYCGLVAAYSCRGDLKNALKIKQRMQDAGVPLTVHVYNALIAACDRSHQYDKAIALSTEMKEAGVTQNSVTQQLLDGVCREGVKAVENQQAAIAALSAAVAAAGSVLIRAGMF